MVDFVKYMKKVVDESNEDDLGSEETFWKDIPNSNLLHHLTEYSWINFVRENPKVMIVIYDVSCPNCKAIRTQIAECAHLLPTKKVPGAIGVTRVDMFNQHRVEHLWEQSMGVPMFLWFESGYKQFEYTGMRTSDALFDFMKNPEKYRPAIDRDWSMEFSSENVHHLDDSTFNTFINDGEDVLVFLYSPTCTSCIGMKHEYEEAATILDEVKYDASLAAVNIMKAPGVKIKLNVDSTPAFLYFKNGKFKYQYYGKTTAEDFIDFMLKPAYIENPIALDDWKSNKNVIHLDKNTIDLFIKENENILILFYAPWCGHCKKLKPAYFKAADILAKKSTSAKLAAINAEKSKALNSKYDVNGFPTLAYFRNHKFVSHYNEERSTDILVDYMLNSGVPSHKKKKSPGTGKTEVDVINGTRPHEVTYLEPDNFAEFISSHKSVMIMFYAPWCAACKIAKIPFFNAAVEIEEDFPETSLAIFNADMYRSYTEHFNVKGYPTFWFFRNGERLFKYHGSLTAEALTEFLANPLEEPEPESPADDVMWISEKSEVRHLSRENFEKFLDQHKSVMVFFYINACEFCLTTLKPKYTEAASILSREHWNAKLTAINAEWEKPIANKFSVNAFPTLLYFRDGKLKYKYQGSTEATSLIKFMKNPTEELARKRKPVSWQDMSSEEYGRVEHLSNKTYDSFIDRYENAMVMFHSAYYSRCLSPRRQFREAGDKLPKKIGLGAVDCHRKPEQGIICYNLKIRKFPAFKYYHRGQFISDFDGAIADDFVLFLEENARRSQRDEL